MNNKLDNLLQNESFLNYYFQKNELDIWKWEDFQETYPESIIAINNAKKALNKLSLKWSEEQIRNKYQILSTNIRASEYSKSKIFKFSKSFYTSIAASVVLLLGFFWFFNQQNVSPIYNNLTKEKQLIETINTSEKPMLVLLSDGSSIMLEKNSRLSYPKEFNESKREVYLDGEAFFEISKNAQKPFLVYANEIVTKVLGTSFRIKASKDQKVINVIVNTGKVSVYSLNEIQTNTEKQKLEGVVITQNQQISFNKKQTNFIKTVVEQPKLLSLNNEVRFEFLDATAGDVFKSIQKAYGITVIFDEELMKNCPVTASLTDEPLFGKIDLVCQAIEAEYELLDGQIIITSKGCK